jgi:cytochrome c-type biogenesis protein CcmH/NrfG
VQANPLASQKEKEYLENKINCYRDQIQKNPNDAEAYTNIGEAERRLGNLEDSRKAHQKALELEPSLPKAKIALALVEQDMGNNVAANTAIKGVLALNPSNAIAHLYQGAILYAQDEFNDAEVALQKAKQLDPKLPELVRTRRLPHLRNVQISER